jgi:nucleoside-diphosphate-sugar epimerase
MSTVLVTGAFGNVGRHTVRALLGDGWHVVATDLRTPVAETACAGFGDDGLEVRWADLTDPDAVRELVAGCRPDAVVHLAAVIPPLAYRRPAVAAAVNVEATRHLVEAVEGLEQPCRLVHTSSIAVHGSRNPHTMEPLTAETPVRPCETYGFGKAAAEEIVTASGTDWTILRLGAVIFPDMELGMDQDTLFLESMLPADARVHSVDVRDVARALANATTASCSGEVLLIAGDHTHRMTQGAMSRSLTAALGLRGILPPGAPGDPDDDDAWFVVDWMDTTRAQEVLDFQRHTWQRTLREIAEHVGVLRRFMPLAVPFGRIYFTLSSPRSPLRPGSSRSPYAELWPSVVARWGAEAVAPHPERL